MFGGVASFRTLHAAAREAVKGKRGKPGAAAFMANLEPELLRLERELLAGGYRPGSYTTFTVKEPKERFISAAPFRDRVVHHALCAVVEPLFERGFINDSYANRVGKGTHRAVACYERYHDRFRHVLRCDLYRFFPSIDHAILKREFRRRIRCGRTLARRRLLLHPRKTQVVRTAEPGRCSRRVNRGGSWNNEPRNVRSANRNRNGTANRNNTGFRLAGTLHSRRRLRSKRGRRRRAGVGSDRAT